ncbi:MAG: tetratricopeptide repeat protein [Phycisphaerales bacterium]
MTPAGGEPVMDRALRVYRELVDAAPADERVWLQERCGDDSELLRAVAGMLEGGDDDARLIPAVDDMLRAESVPPSDAPAGIRIPGIELGRLLGRGGSGDVYQGRQLQPGRAVAIKLLRAGLASERAKSRFEQESRVLATLSHPAIATMYQAGTAAHPSGAEIPYFVMELVEGVPLTKAAHALEPTARAALLARVARGVHAAHQAGVVHRDLKPGNILVDAQGQPKILDFGIARLLDDATGSVHTVTGEVLGTLSYMSPEQIDPSVGRLDTRTDVYSLGVLMYEALTGRRAIEQDECSSIEIATRILRGDLPRLDARSLGLPSDCDAVYRKATDPDPDRRYDSAAAFAEDLERLCDGRPVSARAPTTAYLLSRYARRNPAVVTIACLLVVTAAVLGTLATVGFVSASRQRDAAIEANERAERERDAAIETGARLETSYRFLRSMISSADPDIDGPDVRVVDLLDRWAATIEQQSIGDPVAQIDLHRTVGWTYASLSLHDQAVHHFERALDLARPRFEPGDAVMLNLATDIANSLVHTGELERAVQIAQNAVDLVVLTDAESVETRVAALIALGEAQRMTGSARAAIETLEEAVELGETRLGDTNEHTRSALSALGRSYLELQLAADAVELYERLVTSTRASLGGDSPSTLKAIGNLATALGYAGDAERSVELFESVIDRMEQVLGTDHYDVRTFRGNMVDVLAATGRSDEALELSRRVVADERRIGGGAHPDTAVALNNYTVLLMQLDRPKEAHEAAEELVRVSNEAFGPDHPRSMLALRNYAQACELIGERDEAVRIQQDLLARQQRLLGPTEYDTLVTHNNLGMLLRSMERGDEAVEHLRVVVEHTGPESGYPGFLYAIFQRNLARCLLAAGRLDEAASVLDDARAADPNNEDHQAKCDEVETSIAEAREG